MSLVGTTNLMLSGGIKKSIGALIETRDVLKSYKALTLNQKTGQKEFKEIFQFSKEFSEIPLVAILIQNDKDILRINCTENQLFLKARQDIDNDNNDTDDDTILQGDIIEANQLQAEDQLYYFDILANKYKLVDVVRIVSYPKNEKFVYGIRLMQNDFYLANNILVHY